MLNSVVQFILGIQGNVLWFYVKKRKRDLINTFLRTGLNGEDLIRAFGWQEEKKRSFEKCFPGKSARAGQPYWIVIFLEEILNWKKKKM